MGGDGGPPLDNAGAEGLWGGGWKKPFFIAENGEFIPEKHACRGRGQAALGAALPRSLYFLGKCTAECVDGAMVFAAQGA